ncbi:MAG: S26 family signal peptidase [Lachnospiraceae bacterium]|nr:S26 family signal peptidase [Lachnospiraceae bacterium]
MTYEEYLEENDSLTYRNIGVSMLPLLRQGKDLFTVKKKGVDRCKVGDVVLYRRPPQSYVLHRIIEVRAEDYVILGDNCIRKESGIRDEDIIGVMTGYVRNGKVHCVTEKGYAIYSFFILHTISVRIFIKKTVLHIKSILHKIKD